MDGRVMRRTQNSFSKLILPLSILVFIAFALFIERSGISYSISNKPSNFLDPLLFETVLGNPDTHAEKADILILYDSEGVDQLKTKISLNAVFDNMRLDFKEVDMSSYSDVNFNQYQSVVSALTDFEKMAPLLPDLINWLENGGRLFFAIRPDNSPAFRQIAPLLGIAFLDNGYVDSEGVEFLSNLLPGVANMQFGTDFLIHSVLPVVLHPDTKLHMISADELGTPILWEWEQGLGKVVFINSNSFSEKASRGLIGAAFSLLHDVVIFPVINSAVFFIDDFPSPVPEGRDADIFRQFTRDIESFYLNIWWPDMQALQEKYKTRYSTVTIETYEHKLEPPFEFHHPQGDLFQYFGGYVLRDGGEVGIHGYNHVPLCEESDGKNQVMDYPSWPSTDAMQASIMELTRFNTSLFPEQKIEIYVPPSNILCDEARDWLPEVVPDLRVIASIYIPSEEIPAYVQEFEEAEDGIIELPRITSGFLPDNYMYWAAANELWLHYYFGHFVHPDDVLDSYRSKGKSWLDMRESMDEFLLWNFSSAPGIRNLTASEAGMAVQRYARLKPTYDCNEMSCAISLDGFYDEAWLMMRTDFQPSSVFGGNITDVSDGLYLIEAEKAIITVRFEK